MQDLLELAAGGRLDETALCGLLGKVGLCANEYIDRELNRQPFGRGRSSASRSPAFWPARRSSRF